VTRITVTVQGLLTVRARADALHSAVVRAIQSGNATEYGTVKSGGSMSRVAGLVAAALALVLGWPAGGAAAEADSAWLQKLQALHWVKGPATVDVPGDSTLVIPEGYAFLNQAETTKFLELNQNLSSGQEVMIAPQSLDWSAYFSFADEGYVKDNEAIDAAALLQSLQDATRAGNAERQRRGWPELRVVDWARAPAYNSVTKRLEWATLLESEGRQSANFLTKILGRRGHATVVLAAAPADLASAQGTLNSLLTGYSFNAGATYGDYRSGDRVAEYGLAALILGGAAAIATKKGFWAIAASAIAASWKFIAVGVVALGGALRRFLSGKKAN
jgi:uncharacterized membrane-anchored protein